MTTSQANLHDMNFQPSYADPDVWMQAATKTNGFKHTGLHGRFAYHTPLNKDNCKCYQKDLSFKR